MKYLPIVLTLAISATALLGDYVVFRSRYSESQMFRALSDSVVHASIGLLSAIVFFCHEFSITNYACFCNIAFCTMLSSLIDVDHIFVAKSFHLKDMTNLKQRGIFHCTTFWLFISATFLSYSCLAKRLNLYVLTWMIIIAYSSHHIRDANRRGLWMYPFGHTPALTKYLYVCLVCMLPHVYAYVYKFMEPNVFKHTVVNYYDYKLLV